MTLDARHKLIPKFPIFLAPSRCQGRSRSRLTNRGPGAIIAMALDILERVGQDKRRRALFRCRCVCGGEVVLRLDVARRQKTCGECASSETELTSSENELTPVAPSPVPAAPIPTPAPPALPQANVPPTPGLPVRDAAYYLGELAANADALRKLDEQMADLSRLLAKEGVMPAGMDGDSAAKLYRETVTTATVLRKERKRLEKELRDLSSQKATPQLNAAQSVLARARNLRGAQ
jgi:hypothetical protein